MNMKDGATGKVMWESNSWGDDMFTREYEGRYSNVVVDEYSLQYGNSFLTTPRGGQYRHPLKVLARDF